MHQAIMASGGSQGAGGARRHPGLSCATGTTRPRRVDDLTSLVVPGLKVDVPFKAQYEWMSTRS